MKVIIFEEEIESSLFEKNISKEIPKIPTSEQFDDAFKILNKEEK